MNKTENTESRESVEVCPKCGSSNIYSKFYEKGTEKLKKELREEEKIYYHFDGKRFGQKIYKSKYNYILHICRDCFEVWTQEVEI